MRFSIFIFALFVSFSAYGQVAKPKYSYSSLSDKNESYISELDRIINLPDTLKQKSADEDINELLEQVKLSNDLAYQDYFFKKLQKFPDFYLSSPTKQGIYKIYDGNPEKLSFYYIIFCGKSGINLELDVEAILKSDNISSFKSIQWASLLYLARNGNNEAEEKVFKVFDSITDLALKFGVLSYHIAYLKTDNAKNKILDLGLEDDFIIQTGDEIPIVYDEIDPVIVYLPKILAKVFLNESTVELNSREAVLDYIRRNEFTFKSDIVLK